MWQHLMSYIGCVDIDYEGVFADIDRGDLAAVNTNWTCVAIPVRDSKPILDFATLQLGKPFNALGMRLNFISPLEIGVTANDPLARDAPSFFCSELVTTCLQQVGLFPQLTPCKCRPQNLYNAMAQLNDIKFIQHPGRFLSAQAQEQMKQEVAPVAPRSQRISASTYTNIV